MTSPRHVVFVHQTFSAGNSEGSGRANAIAEAMARAGYQISIVAGANSYLTGDIPESHRGKWLSVETVGQYSVYRPWTYANLHKSYLHRAIYFLVYMCTSALALLRMPRYDIIVGCSPPITVAVAALIAATLRRATFILEVRDLWPAFPIQMGVIRNRLLIRLSEFIEKVLYRNARLIVINSPGFIPHLSSRGIHAAKLVVIPNGVDTTTFRPIPPDAQLQSTLGLTGKFTLLYIGAHGPANSLHVLLGAAALLLRDEPTLHVLLVGAGKEKQELQQRAEREGIRNVTFLPPQPKEEIPQYIALADMCYASLQNISMFTTTYPNKIFDYLACGKPTLTTIDGVSRHIIEASGSGFYVQHDAREVAERIRWAIRHPEELNAMGRRARETALKDWDRAQFAERFVKAIDSF